MNQLVLVSQTRPVRRRLVLVALAVAINFAVTGVAHAAELIAEVGPARTISMREPNGDLVRRIDPGTYTITVRDLSAEHNFHLYGPGVNVMTTVEAVETVVWTVTFTAGTYNYVCVPHAQVMRGLFSVQAATAPAPPPTSTPPATAGRLVATLGPGSRLLLSLEGGGSVRSIRAGTYVIVVRDRSRRHSLRFAGHGMQRRTGGRFTGTVRWRLTLHPGLYRLSSTPGGASRTLRVR